MVGIYWMDGKIYELWELPMEKPSIVNHALKFLDQKKLLEYFNQPIPYSRSRLIPLINLGIEKGVIRTKLGRVPQKGTLRFVDQRNFQREFDFFIQKIENGEIQRNRIKSLLRDKSLPDQTFKRRIEFFISNNHWAFSLYFYGVKHFLPIAEVFFSSPERYVSLARLNLFRPRQNPDEIIELLTLLKNREVRNILEIGTSRGGTLYLFARMTDRSAKLISIDIHQNFNKLVDTFPRGKQEIILIEADSNNRATIEKIADHFPDGIDFLFIDGDHSYDGVRLDFEFYSPFIKPGGMIAFHDIVEDNESRYGVVTGGWAGGVPQLWEEIKSEYKFIEFIAHPGQDGQGIGVLFVPTI